MKKESPKHVPFSAKSHGVEFDADQLKEVESMIAKGYTRSLAELTVVETTPDVLGMDLPPPLDLSDPEVCEILESDAEPIYETEEEIKAALREKATHLTPVKLAKFLCKVIVMPVAATVVESYFGQAFPAIPKETLKATRAWVRFRVGTMTDAEFNALLQPFIGPKAAPGA
jgi:hypothetical protein